MTEFQPTTLTKAALLGRARKPRYETVEIAGFGTVGIRQRTRLMGIQRAYSMFDDNGKVIERKRDMAPIYRLIDQLMVDEKTPMFSESDADELAALAEGELDELYAAVQVFNSSLPPEPKKTDASSDSNEN